MKWLGACRAVVLWLSVSELQDGHTATDLAREPSSDESTGGRRSAIGSAGGTEDRDAAKRLGELLTAIDESDKLLQKLRYIDGGWSVQGLPCIFRNP